MLETPPPPPPSNIDSCTTYTAMSLYDTVTKTTAHLLLSGGDGGGGRRAVDLQRDSKVVQERLHVLHTHQPTRSTPGWTETGTTWSIE